MKLLSGDAGFLTRRAYVDYKFAMTSKGRVLQSFYDRHVRIFQIGVLPHQCDRNVIEETFLAAEKMGHEFQHALVLGPTWW